MDVTDLLRYTVEMGASDLHLKAGNVPFIRVDGELTPTPHPAMSADDIRRQTQEVWDSFYSFRNIWERRL